MLIFCVNQAVTMAPFGSACQNAENAPFKKRAILVVFWVKSEREFTFLSENEIFLFLSSCLRDELPARRFSSFSLCTFPFFFCADKLGRD